MILKSVRIREYKNIRDSGAVDIHHGITCLVGKNESGKSSLLEAMYRLNPSTTGHPETFAALRDYPRRRYGQDRERVPETCPITATFELEEKDVRAVEEVHASGILASRRITVSRNYDNETRWHFECDEATVRAASPPPVREEASAASSETRSDRCVLGGERREASGTDTIRDLPGSVRRILEERLPRFLYFDEYSVISGRLSLARLQCAEERSLEPGERSALALLRLAKVDVSNFGAGEYEARKAALEAAANGLTDEVLRYWTQNPHLCVELDIDLDGRGEPGAPFIDIRIRNQRHRITLNFNERSQGFTWFFSFLATLSEVRRSDRAILLLDEPGLGLHAAAQRDLLRFIEEGLAPSHQVIYSTHSPFMIAATALERVRTVEDRDGAGSCVSHAFFDHSRDTRLPLQASLGSELIHSLPVGADTLFVEGPSDHVFLTVLSTHLERQGRSSLDSRWTVVPVGGLSGVCAFAALLETRPNVAIIADLQDGEERIAVSTAGREILAREGVIRLTEITGTEEAGIEDLFAEEFYVGLVNRSHAATVEAFEVRGVGRIVERIESATGTGFNRYLPARFLLEHPEAPSPSAWTKPPCSASRLSSGRSTSRSACAEGGRGVARNPIVSLPGIPPPWARCSVSARRSRRRNEVHGQSSVRSKIPE